MIAQSQMEELRVLQMARDKLESEAAESASGSKVYCFFKLWLVALQGYNLVCHVMIGADRSTCNPRP